MKKYLNIFLEYFVKDIFYGYSIWDRKYVEVRNLIIINR